MSPDLTLSVKEARKLLGKQYKHFSDDEIEEIVILLDTVAKEFIQTSVPDSHNY